MEKYEIELPSIEVQEEISTILTLLDDIIINNKKINTVIESITKTIYDYWLLQFEFPNTEGKPYKSSGGKIVWNEELKREIPEGWMVKKYKDIGGTLTGREDANFALKNGKYAYLTCGSEILKCDEYMFDGKALLIASNEDFNVKYYDGKFNAYQRTYILMPDEKFIRLLHQVLLRKIDHFKKGRNGSIVKFITKGDIDNIDLVIPDNVNLLKPFNTFLDTIHQNNQQNQEITSLRDFLLPLLINGQATSKES